MKVQVLIGNEVYEVEVDGAAAAPSSITGKPVAIPLTPAVQSEVPERLDLAGESDGKKLYSPLAGIVARVCVEAGQQLQAGDLMLVLEAMKMETKLTSPRPLKPKLVNVVAGDVVKPNQVLIEFE